MPNNLKFILDSDNKSMIYTNCIKDMISAIQAKKVTEIYIATAYNNGIVNQKIQEFWGILIKETKITVHFFFRLDKQKPITLDFLRYSKDYPHIKWYPIREHFHSKIIYAKTWGYI